MAGVRGFIAMKVKVEIDIPDEDYSRIVKWLKANGAEGTLAEIFEQDIINMVRRWKVRANKYFKTGMTAYERFKMRIGDDNEQSYHQG